MIRKNFLKIKEKVRSVNHFRKKESIYSRLDERYKSLKIEYLPEIPSKLELKRYIEKNKFVVFLGNKTRDSIVGKLKYVSFLSFIEKDGIHFLSSSFNPEHKNSLRNLYDIKKYTEFLVKFSRKNGIKKIKTESWLFEELKGFDKYIGGFKPVNLTELTSYKQKLKENNVKKVLSYDFNNNVLVCFTKEGKEIEIITKLPSYVLKV